MRMNTNIFKVCATALKSLTSRQVLPNIGVAQQAVHLSMAVSAKIQYLQQQNFAARQKARRAELFFFC